MVDWLDFYNRRRSTTAITRDSMFLGVYDSTLMDCVNDVLRLRTELFSSSQIASLFQKYTSMMNPFLSSLYVTKIMKVVNKQHREGSFFYQLFSIELMFNTSITSEYDREGALVILALLFNQRDPMCWWRFIQWLIDVSFYREDEAIFTLLNSTPIENTNQVLHYTLDSITSLVVSKTEDLPVYHNILQIFHYFIESNITLLETALLSPQYTVLKEVYNAEQSETSSFLFKVITRNIYSSITVEAIHGYKYNSYVWFFSNRPPNSPDFWNSLFVETRCL